MNLVEDLKVSGQWHGNHPAGQGEILTFSKRIGIPLPESVRTFFTHYDGGEGGLGQGKNTVRILSLDEILEYQEEWSVDEQLQGHILLGSDCGDFALLLDTTRGLRDGEYPVVICPISSLSTGDIEPYTDDFPSLFYRSST